MESTWDAAATDLHSVKASEKDDWVSMESIWHAAAIDLPTVKVSEKDGLGQHEVHMGCSNHRLTFCQCVRERWSGSAWGPHGMQQPQTYILSRYQRKMAWVSMESTWDAAATDLQSVKVSENDGLGQHGVHIACSSHRLTNCQGVRERWPGSGWSPHGMQQPQTYILSRCQRKMAWVNMESTWHAAATDLLPVKVSEKDGLGQHGVHMACSSHRLTHCQGVRERWPGSAWNQHVWRKPQTKILQGYRRKFAGDNRQIYLSFQYIVGLPQN